MNRRTLASILAAGLLVALVAVAALLPVPYVTMSPGPTVDVLAERQGEEIVQIEGRERYPTRGRLELTTVSVTSPGRGLSLVEAIRAWFDEDRAVYPRELIYPPDSSVEEERRQSSVQMVQSQDTAIAAALQELGFDPEVVTEVFNVSEDGPADGKLKPRDRILSIDGTPITDAASVVEAVQAVGVGGSAEFVVRRAGERRTVTVTPEAAEGEPDRAVVGVTIGEGYDFPFQVSVNISEKIGGPSAGLIFALAVYDTLTPGSLTQGRDIAGTGTITAEGRVGPIGGIQQKIAAAADSGTDLFLVPPDNCAAALAAEVDAGGIELVRAPTLDSALDSIRTWVEDPDAELPRCR